MTTQCTAVTANQQQHQQKYRDKFMNVSHSVWLLFFLIAIRGNACRAIPILIHIERQTSKCIFFFSPLFKYHVHVSVCVNCFPFELPLRRRVHLHKQQRNKQKSIFKWIHDTGWHSKITECRNKTQMETRSASSENRPVNVLYEALGWSNRIKKARLEAAER